MTRLSVNSRSRDTFGFMETIALAWSALRDRVRWNRLQLHRGTRSNLDYSGLSQQNNHAACRSGFDSGDVDQAASIQKADMWDRSLRCLRLREHFCSTKVQPLDTRCTSNPFQISGRHRLFLRPRSCNRHIDKGEVERWNKLRGE